LEQVPFPLPILDLLGVDLLPLVCPVMMAVVEVVVVYKTRRMYWQVEEVGGD
jgi:hypothetical protein